MSKANNHSIRELKETYRQQHLHSNGMGIPRKQWPGDVQRAVAFMHKHLLSEPKLTVSWIRQQCHINSKTFSARFKRCTGYYPSEYIMHHQLEVAKKMLKETEASVTNIAIEAGFSSLASFANTFRNHEGITPSEWR